MERADVWIRHVQVYNSYLKRFAAAHVSILNGRILYVDTKMATKFQAETVIDGTGKYMIPGLIDIHMHIESSMAAPETFCRRLAACGVTTIVAEPHEIANVMGIGGVKEMIAAAKGAPIDVFYGIPSSVPSTSAELETAGASIGLAEMKALLDEERVVCVGEVMNYREIIRENELEITKFLAYLKKKRPNFVIEGHCPALKDLDLAKFLYLGIDGDHTEHTLEEIRQRVENGMFFEIQAKTLNPALIAYMTESGLYDRFGFVTDDCMADELQEKGHLNAIVKKAIDLGLPPEYAIYCATYTNATRMRFADRGAIAPGKLADFCLLDDLSAFRISDVYKNGQPIYRAGADAKEAQEAKTAYRFPEKYYQSVKIKPPVLADFCAPAPNAREWADVRVIEVKSGTTRTTQRLERMRVKDGLLQWEGSGCLLAMVFERHGKNGNVARGFVSGDCMRRGAAATTYFHDHHNLFVVGADARSMLTAASRAAKLRGGIVTAVGTDARAELALPIAGILSDLPVKEIAASLERVRKSLLELGWTHANPIMSLATLGLPVSPALKLTDRGLVDAAQGRVVSLIAAHG